MRSQFDEQLKQLNLEMVKMGSAVEKAIAAAVDGLVRRDNELAQKAIASDTLIDDMEKEIEHRCLKLLLQQQPVAGDLRRISSALKMITDMERIGDHAVDISEITLFLDKDSEKTELLNIPQMAEETIKMLTNAINAYVYSNAQLAEEVINSDDIVDQLFTDIKHQLAELIIADKSVAQHALDLLMIAKYFERIGDHATNIAEWVVFSITGVHKNTPVM
ncbi:MAG: phosphate signaling complex protein PhoU [Huintestinicola sp.]